MNSICQMMKTLTVLFKNIFINILNNAKSLERLFEAFHILVYIESKRKNIANNIDLPVEKRVQTLKNN